MKLYWFLLGFTFCICFGGIYYRPIKKKIDQFRRDKELLSYLREGKENLLLSIFGCRLYDPPSKPVITEYIFRQHSPKLCGAFFAYVISKETSDVQLEILACLVEKLKKMPFEYRTKFVGGAKSGKLENGAERAKKVGKNLAEMLDSAIPNWRTID